jgi:transcriptional regulator with XRE-family HTH domain
MEIDFTYRDFLSNELRSRQLANKSYSLRAFARDIGISPASLSLTLKGNLGLSVKTAKKVAEEIGLSKNQKDFFVTL